MSSLQCLRDLIFERLTAAAEEIFTHVERTVVEYEEEVDRQRRLLEIVYKPRLKLQRIDLPQQNVCNEEEVFTEQQLCYQDRNFSLDQEEPESVQIKEEEEEICSSQEQLELKQEADTFMLTPDDNEESDHMEPEPDSDHQLLSPVAESQDQAGNKHVEITIVESKEEKDRQCRLMKILWKPKVKLQRLERQQHEVLTEQQLCDQERNSSLDQEEPESLLIKHKDKETCTNQEEEQLELKQEADVFMLTPDDNEESDHMEPEPDSDHQLLSPVAESPEQTVHMRNISGEKPHICNICKKCFSSKGNLIIHKRTHTNEKPFSCETCGKRFLQKKYLLNHKTTHTGEKPHVCNICKKCFARKRTLVYHMRTHTGEKPHICNMCKKCFARQDILMIHKRTHTSEKPYSCETCGKFFRQVAHLSIHKSTHTSEKPFSCETCGKCFTQRKYLMNHRRTHTGEKPHVCNVCNKRFGHKYNLMYHMRTHT